MALMNIENWISVWVQFDYFPREVKDESRWTGEILQEICPQAQEWELVRELSCLSVPEEILWRPGGAHKGAFVHFIFRGK